MLVIKVYGESCNYYLGIGGKGVKSVSEAAHFGDEDSARQFCYSCRNRGLFLSRWEIVQANCQ